MMWNEVMAIPALIGCLWMLRGVLALLLEGRDPTLRHMAWAAAFLVVATAMRGFFWDIGAAIYGDAWVRVASALGGIKFNAVFYVLILVAVWHFGKVLQNLIPEGERDDWPFWKVPFYPYGLCLSRLNIVRKRRKDEG